MHCSTLHTVSANSDFSCGLENNYIVCLVNITLVVGLVQFQNIKLNISETLIIAFQKKNHIHRIQIYKNYAYNVFQFKF